MIRTVRRRSPSATAILSLAIVLVAVAVVVVVQRHREKTKSGSQSSSAGSMPNMAGMPNMPGMSGDTSTNGSRITVTPAQQRELGMTLGSVEMRKLVADTRATGVVAFDETHIAKVALKFNGFVERLFVNATGQQIARGQPLFDIYSPDVLVAEQELLVAGQFERSTGQSDIPGVQGKPADLVAAARRRLELWDISPAQIDDVLSAGRVRRAFMLYSPASGVVVTKNVVEGQAVAAGESLYTIADLTDVWIDVQLRESDAFAARTGADADIEITGLPGHVFKGRIAYVYPMLDSASRAVRARIVASNTGRMLMPGMYATVQLRSASRCALTVPISAVLRTGTRNVAFVDVGNGRLQPTEIEIGQIAGDYAEVLSGLRPGQRVVTSAQFLLDSESNLGDVMRSMLSQMPAGSPNGER
ncbi:MAG: efflux RND transporter periplasmic adaptor subunit [Gemmatimonadaceae bacterium]